MDGKMTIAHIIILLVGTSFIIWFSWWASIKEKRYHGLYRFFSFESILLLVLNNYPFWFKIPFSFTQCLSWIVLIVSIFMALAGFLHLINRGKPHGRFENTSLLITSGMFRYIRHPLYCSLLLLGTGIWLKNPGNYISIFLGIINVLAIYFTAREEEKEMLKRFGEPNAVYLKNSRMFIPFIF
jgi:protein-S-isoprenylcysteine O-methyltransferase Ste14